MDIKTIFLIAESLLLAYLFIDFKNFKNRITKKTVKIPDDEIFYQLPNTKLPDFTKDIDPKYQTLKDILLTAELEQWKPKVEVSRGAFDNSYTITIWNAQNTIRFFTIVRIRDKQPYLSFFNIAYVDPNNNEAKNESTSVSYNDDDKVAKLLIMTYLMKVITEHHQGLYNNELDQLKSFKELVTKELVTLNSDKAVTDVLK